jgi:transcriptional regulator with XRE-family HTH domain
MPTDYARAVRIARASAGLTLAQLEARTEIDRANISAMESGRRVPNEAQLEAIGKACDGLNMWAMRLLASRPFRSVLASVTEHDS